MQATVFSRMHARGCNLQMPCACRKSIVSPTTIRRRCGDARCIPAFGLLPPSQNGRRPYKNIFKSKTHMRNSISSILTPDGTSREQKYHPCGAKIERGDMCLVVLNIQIPKNASLCCTAYYINARCLCSRTNVKSYLTTRRYSKVAL